MSKHVVVLLHRKMSKREGEKLVREIWAAKDDYETLTGTRIGLVDYCTIFLEKRYFAIPRLVTEVAYNLIYSLGQHSYDADCNLFLRIFTGEVEEAVRYEQATLEGEILKTLELVDVSINSQVRNMYVIEGSALLLHIPVLADAAQDASQHCMVLVVLRSGC